MAGDEQIGKPVGFHRRGKERHALEQSKAVRGCPGITRPSLIKHQLAHVKVKALTTLPPPATRQLLPGLEYLLAG